jgi:hypothetical protein
MKMTIEDEDNDNNDDGRRTCGNRLFSHLFTCDKPPRIKSNIPHLARGVFLHAPSNRSPYPSVKKKTA